MQTTFRSLIVGAVIAACSVVSAGPIHEQGPDFSSVTPSDTGIGPQAADDFDAFAGDIITDVRWWGLFTAGSPGTATFTLNIYNDDGGLPTAGPTPPLATRTLSGVTAVDTMTNLSGFDVYVFNSSLALDITLPSDDTYWFSVVDTSASSTFGWVSSSPVNGQLSAFTDTPVGAWSSASFDLAFGVFDNSPSTMVPEPTSLALLGMGAFGFFGYGWRRRKQQPETAA